MKTGYEAIEFAAAKNLTLSKYADPFEGERHGLSVEEAREIAKEDPSLIYLDKPAPEGTDMTAYEKAENWYNETPKAEIIHWATANGIDIGQNESQLHEDWHSKVIVAKALEIHGEAEGRADYLARAADVASGAEKESWAWPFTYADDSYLSAVTCPQTAKTVGFPALDDDYEAVMNWEENSDLFLSAFRRGYEAAHKDNPLPGTKYTVDDLILCESADGWSLHAPGATDEEIASGDAPYLVSGPGKPTKADYEKALSMLS